MGKIENKIDRAYQDLPLAELLDAPVSALMGIGDDDAAHLRDAFNIKTVRDLGTNKYFRWAQAMVQLGE